jgi:hypothetical protein
LTSAAASTAANTVPPSPSTEVEANCAEPEKTTNDMTIGAARSQPSDRVTTPKETPMAAVGSRNGSPARIPSR